MPALTELEIQEKRGNYINPPSRDHRVSKLLKENEFRVSLVEDEIWHLSWEEEGKDFAVFQQLQHFCEQTAHLDDKAFRLRIDEISEIALKSPLFQRLHDVPKEKRSKAHQDFSPFEHTINVLRLLNTQGLTTEQRGWLRFYALTHDLGKVVTAIGDIYEDHSYISGLVLFEYLNRDQGMEHDLARKHSQTIEYHHVQQALDDGIIQNRNITQLLSSEQLMYIAALSLADGRSVDGYQHFALRNAQFSVDLLIDVLSMLGEQGAEFLQLFIQGILEFAVEKSGEVQKVIEDFIKWAEKTGRKVELPLIDFTLLNQIKQNRLKI